MAWRIQDNVICGEIDNRSKDIVRGQIWLRGVGKPLQLDLKGNTMPDVAGCMLKFKNPKTPVSLPDDHRLNPVQCGAAGDMTASRKVRVPDVPIDEFIDWDRSKGPPPEHIGNCLYLEWFSEANGRVVIEGVDWQVEISTPEWRMTAQEEEERAQQAAEGMNRLIERLNDAIERQKRGRKDPEEQWDEHDFERFLRECDARTEKFGELLDKYGEAKGGDAKIDEAMGWNSDDFEDDSDSFEPEEIDEPDAEVAGIADFPEPELDPHREGIDWIRKEDGEICHPLQHRCFESAMLFWRELEDLIDDESGRTGVKEVGDFVFELQTTAAKLAGALDPIARKEASPEPAFTVAYLKRALGHLHKSQSNLEKGAELETLSREFVSRARKELFEIREAILALMDELRGRNKA